MSFIDNVTQKVKDVAQATAKKSGEVVEITKLSMTMSAEEEKLVALYSEIGKKVYHNFLQQPASNTYEVEPLIEQVNFVKKNIEELRDKIMEIKNVKACSNCNKELDFAVAFCDACGQKQN